MQVVRVVVVLGIVLARSILATVGFMTAAYATISALFALDHEYDDGLHLTTALLTVSVIALMFELLADGSFVPMEPPPIAKRSVTEHSRGASEDED